MAKVITFGCRLNIYESEVIKQHTDDFSDAIIFNTCAVTKEAERKARQAIRRARRENKDAKIIVTGCAAQVNHSVYANMKEVDKVIGNIEKTKKESYAFLSKWETDSPKVVVNDIMAVKEGASHLVSSFDGKSRAFVEVQNGCNHRCTFCIIPYARGNSRSIPVAKITEQIQILCDKGYREIVLTGVDITGYGQDLPGSPSFGSMVKRLLLMVPDLKRLRISSLDPKELDDEIIDLFCNEKRIMPHMHLSIQSGDNMILKRMKRRHQRDDVIQLCQHIKERRSEVLFGADFIVGFPTETEEMFENTLKIIDECDITFLHSFPYSKREGTPAAKIPSVDPILVKARMKRIKQKANEQMIKANQNMKGKEIKVMFENENNTKADNYMPVLLSGYDLAKAGDILSVVVDVNKEGHLIVKR